MEQERYVMESDVVDENNRRIDRRDSNDDMKSLCNLLTTMSAENIAKTLDIASHINGNVNEALRILMVARFKR